MSVVAGRVAVSWPTAASATAIPVSSVAWPPVSARLAGCLSAGKQPHGAAAWWPQPAARPLWAPTPATGSPTSLQATTPQGPLGHWVSRHSCIRTFRQRVVSLGKVSAEAAVLVTSDARLPLSLCGPSAMAAYLLVPQPPQLSFIKPAGGLRSPAAAK